MITVAKKFEPLYTDREKFIILLTGGRGSGKSYQSSTFIERLTFTSGHVILYCRYTMTNAATSIIPEVVEKIELDNAQHHFKTTKNEVLNLFSGSKIIFKGIQTGSKTQTAKLKGDKGLTTFVGDEMEEWESEEDYEKLMLSVRQKGIQNRILLIMNPTTSDHWIYTKYIENTHEIINIDGVDVQISTHPEVLHIHTTYLDNQENLAEVFLNGAQRIKEESIRQCTINGVLNKAEFNKSKYATKIIGRWADIAEGAIFENWEEGEFDTSLPYCYGQDYGFSIDPDTLVKVAVDNKLKRIYVDEKYYAYAKSQLGMEDLYKINSSLIDKPNDLIVADSAEGRLVFDLSEKGLNIIECYKAPGSVSASITAMSDYTIIVTPDSFNVKKELRNYKWNNKKAGIPIDSYNHAIDPMRYAFDKLQTEYTNDLSLLSMFG